MRTFIKILFFFIIIINTTSIGLFHPGRTDSNGGHHCYTNCSKWGLSQGEYHYHNQKPNTPSNTTTNNNIVDNEDTSIDWILWLMLSGSLVIWIKNLSKK
jgi:hypothetical protein